MRSMSNWVQDTLTKYKHHQTGHVFRQVKTNSITEYKAVIMAAVVVGGLACFSPALWATPQSAAKSTTKAYAQFERKPVARASTGKVAKNANLKTKAVAKSTAVQTSSRAASTGDPCDSRGVGQRVGMELIDECFWKTPTVRHTQGEYIVDFSARVGSYAPTNGQEILVDVRNMSERVLYGGEMRLISGSRVLSTELFDDKDPGGAGALYYKTHYSDEVYTDIRLQFRLNGGVWSQTIPFIVPVKQGVTMPPSRPIKPPVAPLKAAATQVKVPAKLTFLKLSTNKRATATIIVKNKVVKRVTVAGSKSTSFPWKNSWGKRTAAKVIFAGGGQQKVNQLTLRK